MSEDILELLHRERDRRRDEEALFLRAIDEIDCLRVEIERLRDDKDREVEEVAAEAGGAP